MGACRACSLGWRYVSVVVDRFVLCMLAYFRFTSLVGLCCTTAGASWAASECCGCDACGSGLSCWSSSWQPDMPMYLIRMPWLGYWKISMMWPAAPHIRMWDVLLLFYPIVRSCPWTPDWAILSLKCWEMRWKKMWLKWWWRYISLHSNQCVFHRRCWRVPMSDRCYIWGGPSPDFNSIEVFSLSAC